VPADGSRRFRLDPEPPLRPQKQKKATAKNPLRTKKVKERFKSPPAPQIEGSLYASRSFGETRSKDQREQRLKSSCVDQTLAPGGFSVPPQLLRHLGISKDIVVKEKFLDRV